MVRSDLSKVMSVRETEYGCEVCPARHRVFKKGPCVWTHTKDLKVWRKYYLNKRKDWGDWEYRVLLGAVGEDETVWKVTSRGQEVYNWEGMIW